MVSIAGGEPLLHPEIDEMVDALVARKRFVYLCTNGVLLRRKIDLFTPSPYFSFAVHVDGLRERHDEPVAATGVFDEVVAAIREAKARGFRVTTNSTFFNTDSPETVRDVLDFLNDELEVDAMMISPGYAYEKAPDQEHFLGVEQTRAPVPRRLRRRSPATLAAQPHRRCSSTSSRARSTSHCTAVGHPELLGARLAAARATCMADGYVSTYRELVETTDWEPYGRGRDPRCANCMAHCGYEPTAVIATMGSLRQSLRAMRPGA